MNKFKLSVYTSDSIDPYENLAFENTLLQKIRPDEKYLFLYKNRPCVVLGRFQNPLEECNLEAMQASAVKLVRRQSGGGTVYHDLHNLNYSFIHGVREHHKEENHTIILNALKSLGIDAYASGRSDLMAKHEGLEKKFSGSAFKQKKDSAFHHGTLLIDSNLDKLNQYITPKKLSVSSKSIKSVRSTVVNLKQLNSLVSEAILIDEISKSFSEFYHSPYHSFKAEDFDLEYIGELISNEWRYNETPAFSLEWQGAEVKVPKKGLLEFMQTKGLKVI